jgi:transcriptional regulator with XRE-family HTH domain
MGQVEDEVTPFLKARRAALDPAELGLPSGVARRRVRGLRREEVAQLAGISVDYYTRIEQGRAHAVSDAILDAVARALRLTPVEHTFLRNITAPNRRNAVGACAAIAFPQVRPQIQELLDAMGDSVPASVHGPGTDLLAWNRLANQVFPLGYDTMPERERNSAWTVFLNPMARELYLDWAQVAEETVATLRADIGQFPENGRPYQVMCELRDVSEEFRRLWEAQDVRDRDHGVKRIMHPLVGEMVLTYEVFTVPADPNQRLCTFTAPKDSETERKLQELAVTVPAVV